MKRRAFLGAVGSLTSVGTLAYTTREPVESLEIRVWLSSGAAEYDGVAERLREYLERIFDLEYWTLDLSIGGTVDVSTENGARVTSHGEWPLTLATGAVGAPAVTPVADVNLLVTDGQMRRTPTGYGLPHVASVGGARHLAALASFDDLLSTPAADAERVIVPNEPATRSIQVLVHEIGHALGLDHEHGVSFRHGGAIVATPMLSSYAWNGDADVDRSACGRPYPEPAHRPRKLSLEFSACARRELAAYSGSGLG
ncbi:peptidase M10A and M12B matrixin and adamalysin [Haloterrigena sp. SYSU A558-1]|uniref:Peptidase M10A and M12B matrixin and adamalysin n=1 Tax=Haloterrigena gelatinilytica TaxID=2741724 RepID=A0A8J8GQ26_9EURY|nr:peptidase M10A and M12B matrixin and adamalysin [Haloterrigena gelatinilytica]NUB93916.1 peptidase M10A and M12B matrixin and adamalysin [Haloterrigena gelatinilytica]NUC74842.1 peptidase M10A and M12B matrixin and adamalysin [Haloterrigena gelatinilytica]